MSISQYLLGIDDWNNKWKEYQKFVKDFMPTKFIRGVRADVRNSKENPKIGRNEPCKCGSGEKHKKCCLNK